MQKGNWFPGWASEMWNFLSKLCVKVNVCVFLGKELGQSWDPGQVRSRATVWGPQREES